MHGGWSEDFIRDKNARALAEAEERRLARRATEATSSPSLRARAAQRLFRFAVALEREETWRVVWERLEAPRHR